MCCVHDVNDNFYCCMLPLSCVHVYIWHISQTSALINGCKSHSLFKWNGGGARVGKISFVVVIVPANIWHCTRTCMLPPLLHSIQSHVPCVVHWHSVRGEGQHTCTCMCIQYMHGLGYMYMYVLPKSRLIGTCMWYKVRDPRARSVWGRVLYTRYIPCYLPCSK